MEKKYLTLVKKFLNELEAILPNKKIHLQDATYIEDCGIIIEDSILLLFDDINEKEITFFLTYTDNNVLNNYTLRELNDIELKIQAIENISIIKDESI